MSAVDVLAVMDDDRMVLVAASRLSSIPTVIADHDEARAAVADVFAALRGCRDMLRESAKQHRLSGDAGHGRHCDTLADTADAAIARCGGAK